MQLEPGVLEPLRVGRLIGLEVDQTVRRHQPLRGLQCSRLEPGSNGGSRKTRSKRCASARAIQPIASTCSTRSVRRLQPGRPIRAAGAPAPHRARAAAPRQRRARQPRSRVRRCRQRRPGNASPTGRCPSQLKSVTRTRSGVGRRPGASTTGSLLRFQLAADDAHLRRCGCDGSGDRLARCRPHRRTGMPSRASSALAWPTVNSP